MSLHIDRNTIKAFILNELPQKTMSLVADAIDADMRLKRMYEDEKFELDAKLYYANKMTRTDRDKFQQKLLKKMELCREVNQYEEKNTSPEEILRRRSVCETAQSQEMNIPKAHAIGMSIKRWLITASVTVVLIVGGGLVYHSQTDDSLENRLYAKYYTPLSPDDIYVINSSSLNIAKQKYMTGEYVNALLLLKNLPSSITIEVEKDLFIGMSLMEIGQQKEAAEYFEGILANQNRLDYIPKVRWYLGLCYLKIGNKEKAIETFQTIINSNDDYYKKAKRILKKLGN
jgi:tetratricopeptide (TPR) repeat protein